MTALLIRADASSVIGTGHVMRCLALAQSWKQSSPHSPVLFMTAENVPALEALLRAEGILVERLCATPGSLEDAVETAQVAHRHSAAWVAVDSRRPDASFQHALKQKALRVLVFDDDGEAAHYYGDVVLNPNISAQAEWYASREPHTSLLLGARYALLRREFLAWRSWVRESSAQVRHILVTMGGADPSKGTETALDAIALLGDRGFAVKIVVGAANTRWAALSQRAEASPVPMEVVRATTGMPELMAWADLAISAAGGTLWELLFMQVPTIAISIVANQRPAARRLGEMGATLSFDLDSLDPAQLARAVEHLMLSAETRASMASGGRNIIDGRGAARVVHAMRQSQQLLLREAGKDDARLLWEWANDADVRQVSFDQAAIPWETHAQWFTDKLQRSDHLLFIAEQDGIPVGQIRYEIKASDAVVSVSLERTVRGHGLGSSVIRLGSERVFLVLGIDSIHAYTRPDNCGSIEAFRSAGFQAAGSSLVNGNEALHFIQQRKVPHGVNI